MYSPTPSLSTPTPQISPTPVATPSSVPTYQATPTPSGFETPVNWDGKAVPNGDFESGSVFGVLLRQLIRCECHKFDPFRAFRNKMSKLLLRMQARITGQFN